jgi:hypothetical protein
MLIGISIQDPGDRFHPSRMEGQAKEVKTWELTSLEGCREAKAPFLGERVLGYTIPKEEELFIRSGLALSAHCCQESIGQLGLTILSTCR